MSAGRLVSAVVLGGGVTGLAIAHRLLARGCGRIDVTVLEVLRRFLVPWIPFLRADDACRLIGR